MRCPNVASMSDIAILLIIRWSYNIASCRVVIINHNKFVVTLNEHCNSKCRKA